MAACNDTNCPDLNAVIGPLGAPARKWLQLRLFHFLATEAQALQFEKRVCGEAGGLLCITCAPQLETKPNDGKIVRIKQTSGGGAAEATNRKSRSMCGFLFNSLAQRTDYSELEFAWTHHQEGPEGSQMAGQTEEGGEEEGGSGGGAGALTTLSNTRVQYLTADCGV